jgi:manganese/zinc/iron transport system substrate-binding protein
MEVRGMTGLARSQSRRGVLTAAAFLVAALSITPAPTAAAGYRIVGTTGQVADIARNVAGPRAEVGQLLAGGVDPHLYKLTRSDVAILAGADVIFYNGLLLEGKMTDALVRVASTGRPVVAVTLGIPEELLLEPEEFEGAYDPHVWFDLGTWAYAVDEVARTLSAYDPEGAADYAANAEAYKAEILELDAYTRAVLATIPEDVRVLVTAHDAFNYFGRAYDFEVRGIQGLSTESQAGLREIEEIVGLLVEREIPAVFTEASVSDRNVRALIEGARAQGHDVILGGQLFSDTPGAEGTWEGTYLGMLDHNATTIALALGGEAPPDGARGLLGRVESN